MPASSIIVNGQPTRSPNVYSEVDASSMVTNGIGLTSLVLIGDAIGGKPASAFGSSELPLLSATTPDEVSSIFRSGDLRDAGLLSFKASNDAKIPSSPQRVLFYKTNDSTQSDITIKGISPAGLVDALKVTSIQYGAFANQIRLEIASGSTGGVKAIVRYEGVDAEVYDDVGSEAALSVGVEATAPFDSVESLSVRDSYLKANILSEVDADQYKYDQDVTAAERTASIIRLSEAAPYDLPITVFGITAANVPVKVDQTIAATSFGEAGQIEVASTDINLVTGVSVNEEFKGSVELGIVNGGVFAAKKTLTGRVSNYLPSTGAVLTLTAAADMAEVATITGRNQLGATITEDVIPTVAGATTVNLFSMVDSISFSSASSENVTVSYAGPTVLTVIASGSTLWGAGGTLGLKSLSDLPVSSRAAQKLRLVFDAAPAQAGILVVRGIAAGVEQAELINIAAAIGTIESSTQWTSISQVELLEASTGDTPNASTAPTFKVAVEALWLGFAGLTLADLVVNVAAVSGLSASTVREGSSAIAAAILDEADYVIAKNATQAISAISYDLVQALNSSTLVRAESEARVRPVNTAETLLSGGSDYGFDASGLPLTSTPTANFIGAFSHLRDLKNVVIVPLSEEESVHKELAQHCKFMEGAGRDERNGYVGLPSSLNKSQIKARIRSLNSRNVSAVAQDFKAFDELGILQSYGPVMLAVIAGAMQCGSPVGMPLTNKIINATEVLNTGDWSPSRSLEEMLEMSLMFARFNQERGIVWERSLTTWRQDSNAAFTEMSTNESVNVSTKLCRQSVENRIGDRAFAGLAGVLKALIASELQRQIDTGIIKSFAPSSITVQDAGDAFNVQYEIAPLEPVNFIKITAHIRRQPVSA